MIYKRISAVLLLCAILASTLSFSSCSGNSGIDQIAWGDYDALIADIMTETNKTVREEKLHRAEDMLMNTECIVPLYDQRDTYMMKSYLTGVYATEFGAKYFMYADAGEKKDISVNFVELPDSIDPAFAESIVGTTIVANTFSGLYTYGKDGSIIPDLAVDCKLSDDGLTYVITLKTGLKWSDGTPLGASDFIYSWRRVADSSVDSPYAYLLDVVARDETGKLMMAADETDTILTVTLSAPCDYFIDLCAIPALYPVRQMAVEYADGYMDAYGNILDADAWTKTAAYPTSGAYYLSELSDGNLTFKTNKNYHNRDSVTLGSVKFILGTDSDAAYDSYMAGELDLIGTVPLSRHTELKNDPEFHMDDIKSVYFLSFNYNSKIFNGYSARSASLLRRAISLYIDREYITSSLTGNGETVATALTPKNISDGDNGLFRENDRDHHYRDQESCGYYSEDTEKNREKARAIIKSLGLDADGDGMIDPAYRFDLTYLTVKNTTNIMIAQAIGQDLAELGIVLKINAVPSEHFAYEQKLSLYDIVSSRAVAYYDDPLSVLEHFIIGADRNYAGLGKKIVIENENAH